jgi:hypothetical protein
MKTRTRTRASVRPAQKVALAIVAAMTAMAATSSFADDKGINRFTVKNCTSAKILVCSYDKTDNILAIPYYARRISAGEKDRFSCGSAKYCKVFFGAAGDGFKRILGNNTGQAIVGTTAGVSGSVGLTVGAGGYATMYLIGAAQVGVAGALGISAAGAVVVAGAAVGTVFAVVKTIDGLAAGDMCKKMMKDQKKIISSIDDDKLRALANDSRKVRVKGRWPGYKNYRVTEKNGAIVFAEGDSCS